MTTAATGDVYAGLVGRAYRAYIRRPRVGKVAGRLLWGSDFAPLYADLRRLRELPEGVRVLDAACGAGLALGWLDANRVARYVGVDTSPSMLAHARRAARRHGFSQAELVLGDLSALAIEDGSMDVVLLYNALQAVEDPEAVAGEVARCLTSGGLLTGSMLVRGGSARGDAMLTRASTGPHRMVGSICTPDDLKRWLIDAGLHDVEVAAADTLALFRARR